MNHDRSHSFKKFPLRQHLVFTFLFFKENFPGNHPRRLRFLQDFIRLFTLSTLSFSNHSQFAEALQETLPDYLYPTVLYPSFLVPPEIVLLILPCFCCCIKRMIKSIYFSQ